MRKWCRVVATCGMGVALLVGLSACAAKAPTKRVAAPPDTEETPVPTVPPHTATPVAEATPLPTRSTAPPVKAKKGESIGPIITFFGAARADGSKADPLEVDKRGVATYQTSAGSGFILVVEAKPGKSELEVARRIFAYVPNDPTVRPDLQIESNRDLGNGSPAVCDRMKPNIGGVPAINPTNFAETQKVSDALNDFACRFETFIESDSSCTMDKNGDYSFMEKKETTTQFCMMVARAYGFPEGDTMLTVRLLDTAGNPGPAKQLRIRRPHNPTAPKPATKKP